MFHAVRDWNRANISGYCEIYLHVPVDQRRARDPKALYRNQIADMVGEDDTFEAPKSPDLVIENYGSLTPTLAVASIWDNLIATDSMLFKEPRYHDKSKPAAAVISRRLPEITQNSDRHTQLRCATPFLPWLANRPGR